MAIGVLQGNGRQASFLPTLTHILQPREHLTPSITSRQEKIDTGRAIVKRAPDDLTKWKGGQKLAAFDNKSQFDGSAVKLDLNLNFSPENLKKTLNQLLTSKKQLLGNKESKTPNTHQKIKNEAAPFLSVDLSVEAKRAEKKKVGKGNDRVRDVHVHHYRESLRKDRFTYRLEKIKLHFERSRRETEDAQVHILNRNGYHIVYRRISQRYQEDLSLKAELLDKFSSVTQKVAKQEPESTEKFVNNTNRLVQNRKVSGKTISKFFDVVESYMDKTEKALHDKINVYIDNISKDFNLSEGRINEMRVNLHTKVDRFFDNVNEMLDKMESGAIKSLEVGNENKPITLPEEEKSVEQLT